MPPRPEVAQIAPPAPPPVAPARVATPAPLNRRQKAAIIVRFLLNEGADLALTDLPEQMQADLTQMMADMRYVDRDTLASVLMEFAGELESVGLSFPRDIAGVLNALEGRISPLTAERLRKEAGVRRAGDPWDRIRDLSLADLGDIIRRESTEVSAVMLAKLDVGKAAELLGTLPGERARRITYAVSMTGGITPDTVDRIGLSLAAAIDDIPPRAFDDDPSKRVGEILNVSPAATREDLLAGLAEADAGFAEEVRKAIFTFADIPARLAPLDVPGVLREVEQTDLVKALAGAQGQQDDVCEFLLSNISSRLADQLREDVQDRGKVPVKEAEIAMTQIVSTIRRMQDRGDLQLRPAEGEDD